MIITSKIERKVFKNGLKEKLFFPKLYILSGLIFLLMSVFTLSHLLFEQIAKKNDN
jgi:hypothetical protein